MKNMLEKLNNRVKILSIGNPSETDTITSLTENLAFALPLDYLSFLRYKTDVEFSVNGSYLRIWNADGCLELNEAYSVNERLTNSLAIGDDGGGGFVLYLTGLEGFGLYYCRIADLDINEAIKIADSLSDFLIEGKGIDVFTEII